MKTQMTELENQTEARSSVYFCLPINDPPVRAALAWAGRDLPDLNPDKYHLTLRHIKGVDRLALDSLIKTARSICQNHQPFRLALDQPGDIPLINCYRPAASQPLLDLQADIDQAVCGLGFPVADYDYNPHITLGRQPKQTVWPVEPASWWVQQVELRRSDKSKEINPLLADFVLGSKTS